MSIRPRLPGRLRLIFQAEPLTPDDRPPVEGSPTPLVELTVYADDAVARGRLALTAHRVTDLMNDSTEFEFIDTRLQSLEDGHELLVSQTLISRDEIFAVAVTGPRGDPAHRTRTRAVPVELRVGRYDVSGNLHVIPGTDPIIGFRRRPAMVPLTEATIAFDAPGGQRVAEFETILVNRDLTGWIAPAVRAIVRPPIRASALVGSDFAEHAAALRSPREA